MPGPPYLQGPGFSWVLRTRWGPEVWDAPGLEPHSCPVRPRVPPSQLFLSTLGHLPLLELSTWVGGAGEGHAQGPSRAGLGFQLQGPGDAHR